MKESKVAVAEVAHSQSLQTALDALRWLSIASVSEWRFIMIKGTWCSGITSASHAEGPGFKSQCVHLCLGLDFSCRDIIEKLLFVEVVEVRLYVRGFGARFVLRFGQAVTSAIV